MGSECVRACSVQNAHVIQYVQLCVASGSGLGRPE